MFTPTFLLIAATLLPLLQFLLLIFGGRRLRRVSGILGTLLIAGSLALSIIALVEWLGRADFAGHSVEATNFRWLPAGDPATSAGALPGALDRVMQQHTTQDRSDISIGVLVDSLTISMFVMITMIALVVHLFSLSYMAGDRRLPTYYATLGLFSFAMLGLVLSNSLVQMFVFWELVGICSYLLIGHWFENRGPALASLKAVMVNRIGDIGFLAALGLLVAHIGFAGLTLFDSSGAPILGPAIRANIGVADTIGFLNYHGPGTVLGFDWVTWTGILFFVGAAAKSAQFPLHVWLPDAMEGPTPVSALIHAATMVAAGVYLIARVYPILTLDARLLIAMVGCFTLTVGALLALVQTDLKRLLAYSTISQLGFMMLFLGCGGYVAGLFHLLTHAFFKASLFLGAGAIIYGCNHVQDIRKLGGLWRKMPITAFAWLVAVLAISGTPYLSGFFSKELGLSVVAQYVDALPRYPVHSFGWATHILYWIPVGVSYLTSIYMWRGWWLVFAGKPRDEEIHAAAHESPAMTLPLLMLTGLVIASGFVFIDRLIEDSLPPATNVLAGSSPRDLNDVFHTVAGWAFAAGPIVVLLVYGRGLKFADRVRRLPVIGLFYLWLRERMFIDFFFEGVVIGIVRSFGWLSARFDRGVIDGLVRGAAALTRKLGSISAAFDAIVIDGAVNLAASAAQSTGLAAVAPQSGRLRIYLLTTLSLLAAAGAVLIITLLLKHG
jgi:NADH-quinone oxidoreductase subunit L